MRLKHKEIKCKSRSDTFTLYALGDVHIGARSCAEKQFKKVVGQIRDDPNALWVGGGDYINAIKPQDVKRYNPEEMPDWMLDGKADEVRAKLSDVVKQEIERFAELVVTIQDKCLGLIEGNHEHSMKAHYNHNVMRALCDRLEVDNLTDCAFLRLSFLREYKESCATKTVKVFVAHGTGGGRTPGAEPNKLFRLAADKDADIFLCGHTHTFCILPPIPVLYIPIAGEMPKEALVKYKRAANWGCWVRGFAAGPSTYDSRALYPVRPLSTLKCIIRPHRGTTNSSAQCGTISMEEVVL